MKEIDRVKKTLGVAQAPKAIHQGLPEEDSK